MPDKEWTAYICSPPPKHALVRFWNELNGRKWTGRASELHPATGVTYLWYKITGIEKEFQSRPYLADGYQIRGYANSRANVAFEALAKVDEP